MSIMNNIVNLFSRKPASPLISSKESVISAITAVGIQMGVNPSLLVPIANMESSLNPLAKATTSSALGLFQFIDSTWIALVKAYGTEDGVVFDPEQRIDPTAATKMMCELIKENQRYLNSKGIKNLTNTDLYLAHFLGPSKAMQFIAQCRQNGSVIGVTMFPVEAKSNTWIFMDKDANPRTLQEIYDLFTERLTKYGLTN